MKKKGKKVSKKVGIGGAEVKAAPTEDERRAAIQSKMRETEAATKARKAELKKGP